VPQPRRALPLVLLAVSAVVAACSGTTRTQVGAPSQTTAVSAEAKRSGPASTTTTTEPRRPRTGSGEPVTIAFAGDASFEGLSGALAANPTGLLSSIAPVLTEADVAVVNLEAALGTKGTPMPKAFNFQTPATALDALRAAGVDAVSMANNHGMDFGVAGLQESLAIEQAKGFPVIGVGQDEEEANAPFVVEVKGQKIAVFAATDVLDDPLRTLWVSGPGKPGLASAEEPQQEAFAARVAEAAEEYDTVAVFLHYGTEKQTCPNARQQDLVRLLTDAGADIVVGGHAHRVQGAGFLGDKAVAYGLGNFVFRVNSPASAESGVLLVTATGHQVDKVEWKPATIRGGIPYPSGASGEQRMAQLRGCAGLTAGPTSPTTTAAPVGATG
jgi:poly-gamma-glutamate capsule biosynthesis protein CapA/YwtB (metallophosphatase superfamily)